MREEKNFEGEFSEEYPRCARINGEYPCAKCGEPKLLEDNAQTWNLFRLCQNQVLFAPDGTLLGLNYPAVLEILRLYEVEDTKDCFEKIVYIFGKLFLTRGETAVETGEDGA